MCIFKYMKVRKNITLSEDADRFLRELAREMGKSQSEVIEELIMGMVREYESKKRLKLFEELISDIETYRGKIGKRSVQEIKREIESEVHKSLR